MADNNVAESLQAVESALDHFADSLERGGFGKGAAAYSQMAEVVLGQRLWTREGDDTNHEARFSHIADLAERIQLQLAPYVDTMNKLGALRGLAPEVSVADLAAKAEPAEAQPPSAASAAKLASSKELILGTIQQAKAPVPLTVLRNDTGLASSVLKRELRALTEAGTLASQLRGGRSYYQAI